MPPLPYDLFRDADFGKSLGEVVTEDFSCCGVFCGIGTGGYYDIRGYK